MSESTSPMTPEPKEPHAAPPPSDHGHHGADGHDAAHHEHPFLAHHFDSPQQQFDAGKLGIWLFLVTEVLFFAGLFCAYTVYRAQHPDVFVYAHYHLDTTLGAINTCVLLLSSLTAAWAVRAAQMADKRVLVLNILITIGCAFGFLGIKYKEYSHKIHEGTLWGHYFKPEHEIWELESFRKKHPEAAELAEHLAAISREGKDGEKSEAPSEAAPAAAAAGSAAPGAAAAPAATVGVPAAAVLSKTQLFQAELAKASPEAIEPLVAAGLIDKNPLAATNIHRPFDAHVFFSIYFFMTGLHGVHVIAGIIVWIWMLTKATKGVFGPNYFGPIDYAALYWHLVDLIWIYLFPLLYLIH